MMERLLSKDRDGHTHTCWLQSNSLPENKVLAHMFLSSIHALHASIQISASTYKVTMVLAHLGSVDLDLECSTILPEQ